MSIQNQLKNITYSPQTIPQTFPKPIQTLNHSNTDKTYAFSECYKNQSKVLKIRPIFNALEVSQIR